MSEQKRAVIQVLPYGFSMWQIKFADHSTYHSVYSVKDTAVKMADALAKGCRPSEVTVYASDGAVESGHLYD